MSVERKDRKERSVVSTVHEARKASFKIHTVSTGRTERNYINASYVRRTLFAIEEVSHSHHYSADNC